MRSQHTVTFQSHLKISGWCYYTSEEEETLVWRLLQGELLYSCSWGCTGALVWPPRMRAAGVLGGSCGARGGQQGKSRTQAPAMMRCNLALRLGKPHVYAICPPGQKTQNPVKRYEGKASIFSEILFLLL